MNRQNRSWVLAVFLCLIFGSTSHLYAQATRIKDLVNIRGQRTNSLIGFGLVIGLNASGDSPASFSTNRALGSVLTRLGMAPDSTPLLTRAAAAVIVTAELPAFVQIGDRIDVKVSTVGDSKSLAGGTLLMTPLRGGDGQYYATAEGPIVVGQANGVGAKSQTVAYMANGGVIERDFAPELLRDGAIDLSLKKADFTTSYRISQAINQAFRNIIATALDPAHVQVRLPEDYMGRLTAFIATLEALQVEPDLKALIVVNERTGTIVIGGDVKISPVVVSHNGLSIAVGSGKDAKKENLVPVQGGTINDLVKGLNQMGVKPEDLVSILQSIHASGALKADLKLL